ncbi:hypothetical protein [Xanthocytophaga agilis]|uniref:Uncharacterized protein n=1 Tax=Xanthocytophaga agilis TaxID=3048010 RepID=A0AAE3R6W5_9BACT|nr:hypothetical protein [Xanthocytophaga agilis]MDJ1504839.1 hypothetical protein [Xanthocytophaga agilis]
MKKSLLKLVFTFVFLCLSAYTYAQMGMGKVEEIEEVMSRKLIVLIEEPREKMLKRIEKKPKRGSIEDYKKDLKIYNENVQAVVEKFWPYNKKDIQYMTFEEINALKKSKSTEYAVLACLSARASSFSAGYLYANGLYWVKDIKEDFEDRDDDMFSVMLVNRIEDWGRVPVFSTTLFDVFPTKASMVYGLKTIDAYFTKRLNIKKNGIKAKEEKERVLAEMKERAPKVTEKTLLIREEWLDKELTAANFKTFYPYKYQICDRETMDNVVMNEDANYVYGVELPIVMSTSRSTFVVYTQYVMDGKDSQPIVFIKPNYGGMMLASSFTGKAGTRNFTIKTLNKIVEQVQGKGIEVE